MKQYKFGIVCLIVNSIFRPYYETFRAVADLNISLFLMKTFLTNK